LLEDTQIKLSEVNQRHLRNVGPGDGGGARALKCLYLAIMSLDPTGKGCRRWTNWWKVALNVFDITYDGRLSAGRK
jgi:hypothetical protein